MNISRNWLKKYVDFDLSDEDLAAKLTMAGLEVEAVKKTGKVPDGVVTAKILARKKHENSDHLSVCDVDRGGEVLQIVCGAPNCDAGNIVPLATIGTVFPDGDGTFTIKKGKLRGVESFGMMCSARELGLGADHDGLMILPADTKIGVPLGELLDCDTVYDCSVTPNRPDWLSHIGVARDLAALLGKPLKDAAKVPWDKSASENKNLVSVEAPDLCPLYAARIIRGVKIGESPDWMKKALAAVGIRPINNIVDITNFVMMEHGVPLHAFDIRNLKEGRIVVRRAKDGESIVALDGKKYDLSGKDLCICDAEKPVAVAGVMGGEYSGVQPDTETVVLESAWFEPDSIRLTSRRLGLASDASYRYERGVDRGHVLDAGHRACNLILELAGGEYTQYCEAAQPAPESKIISADCGRIRGILGMDVSDERIAEILVSLGFERKGDCAFQVPSWRVFDVAGEADLAEEVARIHGLDKLPDLPIRAPGADFSKDACIAFEILRGQLCAVGADEILSMSLIDEKSATADGIFTADDLIRPVNPISLELAIPRPSLFPGLLNAVRYNVARQNPDLALFEIGHVFCANKEKFPEERDELGIILTGRVHPEFHSAERNVLYDFFDLKGMLEQLFDLRKLQRVVFETAEDPRFLRGVCAAVKIDGKLCGFLGEVVPKLTKGMRLTAPLYAAVLQLDVLFGAKTKDSLYQPISQFPATTRDVAFFAPRELEYRKVADFIRNAHIPNLENVSLFDVFEDKETKRKSMACSLLFRSSERTLTDDEVNAAQEKLRMKLEKGLGVELR